MHTPEDYSESLTDSDTNRFGISFEIIDESQPKLNRGFNQPMPLTHESQDRLKRPWDEGSERDVGITRSHVNRRFDELHQTMCSMVGALHSEVAALKSAVDTEYAVDDVASDISLHAQVDGLAERAASLTEDEARTLFNLISDYEVRPNFDVAQCALHWLDQGEAATRAASAGALGVLKSPDMTGALGSAYQREENRRVKKIIGDSLKSLLN